MQETESKYINKVVYLSNNDILPNRFQPRKYFDEEEIMQLSESIKEHGVINPVIVRKLGDKYELVAGERRYKANILAGNDNIPAIIMDINDKESSEIAVVENIQRKDLNAIEEAISYKRILDIGYMTQDQLAQKMGKSQSSIANKIRLLKLSDEVQDALMKKQISERHARSLLKLESQKKQNELLERIINERLTVRKTDEEIEKMNNNMNNNMNDFNNIYNNTPDSLTPIMPGSNVSDVNISGIQQPPQPQINNFVEPSIPSTVIDKTVQQPTNSSDTSIINNLVSDLSNVQDMPLGPVEPPRVETIPTMSIDDVLAKANQPSVVGNQLFNQQDDGSSGNGFQIPNFTPINENPTPIVQSQNSNQAFEMPDLNPINENSVEPLSQSINDFQGLNVQNLNTVDKSQPIINEQHNFGIQNYENQGPTADFINSDFNSISTNENNMENNYTESNNTLNTFAPFSLNKEKTSDDSPISTSPIIDMSQKNINNQSNSFGFDNGLENIGNNNNSIQPQQQFEKVPEPIIVNDYNDQYAPIMPKPQNQQPTIDFKTIINLIRKCSQAIENSGYKIETEEYNLDNLYQVVFKINKQ